MRASPRVGIRLGGRYRILGQIGEGSTADIYLAEDENAEQQSAEPSGKRVVIKWLTSHAARDPQLRERFIVGARAAMAVEHPAVAKVYRVEAPEAMPPYLVMEALPGEPLSEYVDRMGPVPEPQVIGLGRAIAAGLHAAHQVGIIHRDVKPANLFLVGPIGAPTGIRIIDFGLAKDTNSGASGPNSTNVVMGTGQYMAPEQVLADPVDARTDVYALGVVLFRMLTGQLPFDVDPGVDLFSHQLFSPAPPPSWLVENIDPRLESVLLRCMRKHPENRYPSMAALLQDLDAIADDTTGKSGLPLSLAREPDVYKPRNPQGRGVAEYLAVYFGSEPPPPPSVQIHAGHAPASHDSSD